MYKYGIAFMCVATVANNFGMDIFKPFRRGNKKIKFYELVIWEGKNLKDVASDEIVSALKRRIVMNNMTKLNGVNLAHCDLSEIDMDDLVDFINCTVDISTN